MSDDNDITAPFQTHSITSIEAAEAISPHVNELQARVLEFVRSHPGVTDEQIVEGTGLAPNTARPRRIELARKRLIVEAGEGKTRSGRRAVTWKAAA